MPIDPPQQLALFTEAVAAIGGQHAAARALKVNERTVRRLIAGERELHDGWLRDIAAALAAHAARCRELERRLTPAFAANLTERQVERQGKPDARRFDAPFAHGELPPDFDRENADG